MTLGTNKSTERTIFGPLALTVATQRAPAVGTLQPNTNALVLGTQRRVQVMVMYDAAAIGGIASIIPMGCSMPGDDINIQADNWYALGVWDGTVTGGAFPGTFVATTAFTSTQSWGRCIVYPQELRTPAALNAADKVRITFSLDVGGLRRLAFHVAEVGGVAAGTLTLKTAPYA